MNRFLNNIREALLMQPPEELAPAFAHDCAKRNNFRLMLLPYLNILSQIGSYIIYLHIYPTTYPERGRLDETSFTIYSILYVVINILFILQFTRMRRMEDAPDYARKTHLVVSSFLICYVLLESVETVMEVEISGNIYRFLTTFFVAAFLPLVPRMQKNMMLIGYVVIVELGFAQLVGLGYPGDSHFHVIAVVFLLMALVLSNVVYTSAIRQFLLRHELLEANRKLQDLIVKDPLTGISNRRAFNETIRRIWDECKRNGHALNAMMIDIDHFKRFNDRYGHQKGDQCLIDVARFLSAHFSRSIDMVARYGGEEFVVLLPYTSEEGVAALAESARRGIQSLAIPNEDVPPARVITISVGVVSAVPRLDESYEAFIKKADDALYQAKNSGRNRVCFAPKT